MGKGVGDEPVERLDRMGVHLGKLALDGGLITPEQLREALVEQARAATRGGEPRMLGEILVDKKYITQPQLAELLQKQSRDATERGRPPAGKPALPVKAPTEKPPPKPPGGNKVGKYLVVRELGFGGMGVVYEAVDANLNRKIALKMLIGSSPNADAQETAMEEERFLREARVVANLPRHPHIVGVYEAGALGGKRYIAMQYIEGLQLSAWRKMGSVTIRQQVTLLRDVALAVDHAHRHGVIHRDLKPANILVDAGNQPHVTDFGLAKTIREKSRISLTASGMLMGTPAYMSPEQAEAKKRIDRKSDIWSLGVMLYEVLTGRQPFRGETPIEVLLKVVHDPVPPILGPAAVDATIGGICLKALAKAPHERYPTARAMADDLTAWLKGEAVVIEAPKPDRKRFYIWGAAAAATLLLVGSILAARPWVPSVSAEMKRAAQCERDGRYEEAALIYGEALEKVASHAAAREGRARAVRALAALVEEQGNKHLSAGKYRDALREFDRLLKFDPELAQAGTRKVEQRIAEARAKGEPEPKLSAELEARIKALEEENRRLREEKAKPVPPNPTPAPLPVPPPRPPPAPAPGHTLEIVFGPGGRSQGLKVRDIPDGPFENVVHAGKACVRPKANVDGNHRLYFDAADEWLKPGDAVEVEVEYFDEPRTNFGVEYDSWDLRTGFEGRFKEAGQIAFPGSKIWRLARLTLGDPRFETRQDGGADFRFASGATSWLIHRVTLRRLPLAAPPSKDLLKAETKETVGFSPGLVGEYHEGTEFNRSLKTVIDGVVDFDFFSRPRWPDGPREMLSVRWTGYLRVLYPARYFFQTTSDDGVRLFIDDVPIVSNWSLHAPARDLGSCALDAGLHRVRLEYFQGQQGAVIRLEWRAASVSTLALIPAEALFHKPAEFKPEASPAAPAPPPSGEPAPGSDLVGHWRLDESTGAVAADASGRGHHGRAVNGPSWVAARNGRGLQFDGVDDFLELPNSPELDALQDRSYTLCAWFKPETVPQRRATNDAFGVVLKPGFHEGLRYAWDGRFWLDHWFKDGMVSAVAAAESRPGTFYFLAGVVDSDARTVQVYVNAEPGKANGWAGSSVPRGYGTARWQVGRGAAPGDPYTWAAKGVIDNVRLYRRALSAAVVKALYEEGQAVAPPGRNEVGYKDKDGWVCTFDGKDLGGWERDGGEPRIEDGAILLRGGADVRRAVASREFELRGSLRMVQGNPTLHAGAISVHRVRGAPGDSPRLLFHSDGDIHLRDVPEPTRSGDRKVAMGVWQTFVLRVGTKLTLEIEGKTVLSENLPRGEPGDIVLRSSGGSATIAFKDLWLREK